MLHTGPHVVDLRCEFLQNPLGIGERQPRLSWRLEGGSRGLRQTGFQIRAASTEDGLADESSDTLWDSGRVDSPESLDLRWEGPVLRPRQRVYWQVRVWDQTDAASDWSEPAWFELGLLEPGDWYAQWIEPEQQPAVEEEPLAFPQGLLDPPPPTPPEERLRPGQLLRRPFSADGQVVRARLYATAHGVYRLFINGRRVGDQELAPEPTAYEEYLQVQTYDVTDMVTQGENAVAALLGDGWWVGRIGITGDSVSYGDRLALLAQLELEYADGRTEVVGTDSQWRSATGPLIYSDLFIGEKYDARQEPAGWSEPAFAAADWTPVMLVDHGFSRLKPQYGEPVRAVEEIRPAAILNTPNGETVIDLGQIISGRMRMQISGPAGTTVTLEHSEVLDRDGNFLMNIMGRNKDQTDIYVAAGGDEVYEPLFAFHGFRYVRVTGYPGTPTVDDFTGIVLHSDMETTGSFTCSDERINQLQRNVVWSQRTNMLAIPTDCPQRERAGWTGDIQVFAPTAVRNMNTAAFLTRWLENVRVEQLPNGEIPIVVPYTKGYRVLQDLFGTDSSAGWGDACVVVPWALFQAYGDADILADNYECMVRWVEYIARTARENVPDDVGELSPEALERQQYLWNTGFHFGDWLIPSLTMSKDGERVDMMQTAFLTKELVSTCFYAYSTQLLAEIARILGRSAQAERYSQLNARVRQAFAEEYLAEDGRLKAHFQGIYVLALHMRMVPESMRSRVLQQLVTLIEENGWKLDTGFVSVPFLMDVLCDNGRADVAYKLLFQTGCPSWLYEVEQGATTIWEAWQAITPGGQVTTVSFNHYAFGCISDWLFGHVGGLNPLEPGYRQIAIAPDIDCGLKHAETAFQSRYGTVRSEWVLSGEAVTVNVTVPPNTAGVVSLPHAAMAAVTEGGRPVTEAVGVNSVSQADEAAVIEVISGSYSFKYHRA